MNEYVDANKPWELANHDGMGERLHDVQHLHRGLPHPDDLPKPMLPRLAADVASSIVPPERFADVNKPLGAGPRSVPTST